MSNIITGINGNTSTNPNGATTANGGVVTEAQGANTQLTQADFLQIMVAQFTEQDPLASSDGSGDSGTNDYVNELMSMTNLTTMQTMSGQEAQQLAISLPGDYVEVDDNGTYSDGAVQAARVNATDGGVYFTVNGTEYPLSDLYAIAPASTSGTGSTTGTTPTSSTGSN